MSTYAHVASLSVHSTLISSRGNHWSLAIHADCIEHLSVAGVVNLAEVGRVSAILSNDNTTLGSLDTANLHIRVHCHVLHLLASITFSVTID